MASNSHTPQSLAGKPQRKATRTKTPKTKGGCVTCKARHVKCDETKPSCLRCLRFWGKCEGYSPPKAYSRPRATKPNVPLTAVKPLLPRPQTSSPVILYQSVAENGFKNENEYRYFHVFRDETVDGLPGTFSSELWERVILQACWDEEMEFIRDAAVAIGALSSCGRSLVEDPHRKQLTGTSSYRFALQHYGQAVKKMRLSLSSSNIRKALLGCLLVICFENLQGNYTQALTHAVSGTQILQNWLSKQSYPASEMKKEGIVSPNRHVVEDELVQAFGRLDLQVMAYVDTRPASDHERLMKEGEVTVKYMPTVFKDVDEARLYWEVIQRRSSHFIASTVAQSLKTGKYVPTTRFDFGAGAPVVNFHAESDIFFPKNGNWNKRDEGMLPPEYRKYSGEITRWFDAFHPFYKSIEKEVDGKSWTAASVLQIHAKTSEIMLLSSLFGDESNLDRFLPEYRSVISLAKEIASSPSFEVNKFKFDIGIVNPVRLVAKWCREPQTRREAIGLLRGSAVREGLYDGLVMAKTQGFIMELEEEGMENGKIPEEMRWRFRGVRLDCLRRRAEVEAERLGRRPDGERVVRGTVITW